MSSGTHDSKIIPLMSKNMKSIYKYKSFVFWLAWACFFYLWWWQYFPVHWLLYGLRITEDPSFSTDVYLLKHVWLSIKLLQNVITTFFVALFWVWYENPLYHLGTSFCHVILIQNCLYSFPVNVHSLSYHWDTESVILFKQSNWFFLHFLQFLKWLFQGSSSIFSQTSVNFLCHSSSHAYDLQSFSLASVRILKLFHRCFFSFTIFQINMLTFKVSIILVHNRKHNQTKWWLISISSVFLSCSFRNVQCHCLQGRITYNIVI